MLLEKQQNLKQESRKSKMKYNPLITVEITEFYSNFSFDQKFREINWNIR